ncbi:MULTISPECIES: UDP-2,3-diacylglucosamine diphosphatase [Rhodanobacter]|uniref:UDP-2,3-diacylglucosamine diphosphatase n=1 Tax=Rhodanobacter TaxID=75309 RepID=UPI0004019B34|nr:MULTISPECIES: UDP-2,3-diacylglucosamine diphosphatase [Rhodanobacter]KZC21747.1 UDP-2,3-diacylglucosamine diphosphatase [Rhodanobacter denitrificans]UJM92611.1 UDP-2,3-diacylglucosamine diphosphatase [Rhodanobacter denitrificans]UJM96141.1 UDP-2,3-diacylglucosamine diphosphatase [Rhodanobacter denitrificans]UJN21028.1 UDP-2,3-diacylglucosamine diphosphatase [Rhodanobacter denitrificans]
MATLFIADLHLDPARPQITDLFERYLASDEVRHADALYILGDLVEAWIGDDDDAELPARIAAATRTVRDAGVPVYFMVGNRDFLLGSAFAAGAGLTLLDDGAVHDIHGRRTLLMHGDVLCTDDLAYQAVRQQVRTPEWQAQILAMPLQARRAFAAKAREDSKAHTGSTMESIMDVNADAVAEAMRKADVTRLIHGHTHRPAIHRFELDGKPAERIVLGDWYEQGSVLVADGDRVELRGLAVG